MTRSTCETAVSPPVSARVAGLRYVCHPAKGIRRVRRGRAFRYVSWSGRPIGDTANLKRIRGLRIPPAWREVWIASDPQAHLQATGRDARGRKQYRYHARWREVTLHAHLAQPRRALRGLSADETAVLALLENRRGWRQQLAEAAQAA